MKKRTSLYAWAALGILAACGTKEAPQTQAQEEIPVKIHTVSTQSVAIPVVASGVVASKKEAKLSFKTGGILQRIYAEEGQTVRKGQLLASLNLTEISAQASQARNNQEKAERDLERTKRLFADSAATYEQLQNATTGYEVASSGLRIAQFNLQYSNIYAPDNGRILKRSAEEGELISPGNPVFLFASSNAAQWIVRVGVADRDMVRVRTGDVAQVSLDAYPETEFTGTVTEIAQTADAKTGTFEVELRIDPQGKPLASGMVAKLTIQPSEKPSMLVVPIEALVEADGSNGYVYTLQTDGKHVKKLPVKVALLYGNSVAIREGVKANDVIITDGVSYLTNDSQVKVVKPSEVVSR